MKAKGQVRLRKRRTKSGGWSLYLDIYQAGMRRYEYLRLYLNDERTPEDRIQNAETMRLAEAVRARRNIELQRLGAAMPMPSEKAMSVLLREWVESRRDRSEGTQEVWRCWANRVNSWKGVEVSLKDVGDEWWRKYTEWVRSQDFSQATTHHYLARMRSVLSYAERNGLLARNPARNTTIQAVKNTERVYLSVEELRRLRSVGIPGEVGRAFLFACFCGLRYSDVAALTWEDIQGSRLVKRIVKTRSVEYLDLNSQAMEMLGERGTGQVFAIPKRVRRAQEAVLKAWAEKAGIPKHITFHTSRHTFAVLMLSAGVDIYTLSRLLGHTNVITTQIYADIVDARRRAAVEMFPKI